MSETEETKALSLEDALEAFDQVKGAGLAKAKPAPVVLETPRRRAIEPDDPDPADDDDDDDDGLAESSDDLSVEEAEEEDEDEDDPAAAVEQIAKDLAKYSRRILKAGSFEEARPLMAKALDAAAEGLVAALDASAHGGSDIDAILVQRALMTTSAFLQFLSSNPKIARGWKRMLHDMPEDLRAMLERGLVGSLEQLERAFRHVHQATGVGFDEVARADGQDPEALKRMAADAAKAAEG